MRSRQQGLNDVGSCKFGVMNFPEGNSGLFRAEGLRSSSWRALGLQTLHQAATTSFFLVCFGGCRHPGRKKGGVEIHTASMIAQKFYFFGGCLNSWMAFLLLIILEKSTL